MARKFLSFFSRPVRRVLLILLVVCIELVWRAPLLIDSD
jgi:hypothetical protein